MKAIVTGALVSVMSLSSVSCVTESTYETEVGGNLVFLDLNFDPEGLPAFPKTVGNDESVARLNIAEAARRRRLEANGRTVIRKLRRMGVRSATLEQAGRLLVYVRATLTETAARQARSFAGVRELRSAVRATGRLERDFGWVLVTSSGRRYALNWQLVGQPPGLEDDTELTVEGLTYDTAIFQAPDATALTVRKWTVA